MKAINSETRWNEIASLDEELLRGGVILSEYCALLVRNADLAYVHGAYLAAIVMATASIETHLRAETEGSQHIRLVDLIEISGLAATTRESVNALRRVRNRWVHVEDPWDDSTLISHPDEFEQELEAMARRALRILREVLYDNPCI